LNFPFFTFSSSVLDHTIKMPSDPQPAAAAAATAAAATQPATQPAAQPAAKASKHSHSTSQAQAAPRKVRFNVGTSIDPVTVNLLDS
jgi:hypothetical protein